MCAAAPDASEKPCADATRTARPAAAPAAQTRDPEHESGKRGRQARARDDPARGPHPGAGSRIAAQPLEGQPEFPGVLGPRHERRRDNDLEVEVPPGGNGRNREVQRGARFADAPLEQHPAVRFDAHVGWPRRGRAPVDEAGLALPGGTAVGKPRAYGDPAPAPREVVLALPLRRMEAGDEVGDPAAGVDPDGRVALRGRDDDQRPGNGRQEGGDGRCRPDGAAGESRQERHGHAQRPASYTGSTPAGHPGRRARATCARIVSAAANGECRCPCSLTSTHGSPRP